MISVCPQDRTGGGRTVDGNPWDLRIPVYANPVPPGLEERAGNLRAALARLEGIGPTPLPPPARVSPRDLVLIIDPNRMEIMRFQVRG